MREHSTVSPDRYGELLSEVLPAAGGYARSILRNVADAEDAVQHAAVRGLEHLSDYDPGRSFKTWWLTIVRNCCIDLLRSRRSRIERESAATPVDAAPAATEEWEELALAMDQLSPEHAEILRLRYFSEMSYSELAQALGIPPGTVMSRLHAARTRLAERLQRIQR